MFEVFIRDSWTPSGLAHSLLAPCHRGMALWWAVQLPLRGLALLVGPLLVFGYTWGKRVGPLGSSHAPFLCSTDPSVQLSAWQLLESHWQGWTMKVTVSLWAVVVLKHSMSLLWPSWHSIGPHGVLKYPSPLLSRGLGSTVLGKSA